MVQMTSSFLYKKYSEHSTENVMQSSELFWSHTYTIYYIYTIQLLCFTGLTFMCQQRNLLTLFLPLAITC